jgi:hypothetical protein
MLIEVWEVYKRDSQHCCIFLTESAARTQTIFNEADLVEKAKVDLSENEINELKKDGYLRL